MRSFASLICISATLQTNAFPEEIFAEDEGLSLIQMRKHSHAESTLKIKVAETTELMSSGDVDHKGENCWVTCNGAGFCEWCGSGNACCQGSLDRDADPAECGRGIPSTNAHFHECVAVTEAPPPAEGEPEHKGENCWVACNGAGFCDWCGSGNACCQGSLDRDADPAECGRGIPSTNAHHHECVAVTEAPPPAEGEPEHKGENCWVACNGAGFCGWCGNGNACCQGSLDRDADPTECSKGIPSTNAHHHECVAVTDPPDVEHVAEDCWAPCNGAGFCDWCGSGNACCQGSLDRDADPAECGRGIFSTNAARHECVAVKDPPPPQAEPPAPPPPPPPPAPPAPCTTRKHSRFLVKECPGKKAEVIIRIAGFDASNIDARKQKVMDFFADAVAKSISRALGIPLGEINIVFKNNVSLLQGFDIQQGGQLIVVAEVDPEVLPAELPELDEAALLNDIKAVPDVEAMLAEGVDSLDAIFVVQQGDQAAAVGDPHLTTNTGKKFDLKR